MTLPDFSLTLKKNQISHTSGATFHVILCFPWKYHVLHTAIFYPFIIQIPQTNSFLFPIRDLLHTDIIVFKRCLMWQSLLCVVLLQDIHTQRKKATIHQLTTKLSTSKNVLFPGHNHLLTTGADDPTL